VNEVSNSTKKKDRDRRVRQPDPRIAFARFLAAANGLNLTSLAAFERCHAARWEPNRTGPLPLATSAQRASAGRSGPVPVN
jgi:hypothetical protein